MIRPPQGGLNHQKKKEAKEEMCKNQRIEIKCSKTQKEILKNKAEAEGLSLSEFLLQRGLKDSFIIEKKISEIHRKVCGADAE